MKGILPLALVCIAALSLAVPSQAEEKNGLSVTVTKKTIDRNDTHNNLYFDQIDHTQGLKTTITNVSLNNMPESTIEWKILVRRYLSNAISMSSGTEKVKPLKTSESQDLVIGAAEVTGWRDGTMQAQDKIEWQIIVKQQGNELLRMQSTASFDTLAKRAAKAPNRVQ